MWTVVVIIDFVHSFSVRSAHGEGPQDKSLPLQENNWRKISYIIII